MNGKSTKGKKKVRILIAIIIAILAIVGIIYIVSDSLPKSTIGKEMEKINSTGAVDTNIKTTGKYAEVEKALKDYVVEYQGVAQEIAKEYQNEKFTTILSADNYKKDGPEFKESKQLISDVKEKGEQTKTKLAEMVSEEYKEKRATDCGLEGKYKTLFKDSIKLEDELTDVNETIDNVNNYLDKVDDVFDFLKENKNKWKVNNNKVEFTKMELITKYNSLLTAVNTAAAKLK